MLSNHIATLSRQAQALSGGLLGSGGGGGTPS